MRETEDENEITGRKGKKIFFIFCLKALWFYNDFIYIRKKERSWSGLKRFCLVAVYKSHSQGSNARVNFLHGFDLETERQNSKETFDRSRMPLETCETFERSFEETVTGTHLSLKIAFAVGNCT